MLNTTRDIVALATVLLILLFLLIHTANAGAQNQARADIKNAEGKSVGTASLRETKDGVVGKCDAPAFTSAGGHFNPQNKKHGLKNPDGPHAGDLPDMFVNKDGMGRYEALMESMTLGAGETSVFDADGSAIVVHATADDNLTDPAGNSGDRIACGVITKAEAKGK